MTPDRGALSGTWSPLRKPPARLEFHSHTHCLKSSAPGLWTPAGQGEGGRLGFRKTDLWAGAPGFWIMLIRQVAMKNKA